MSYRLYHKDGRLSRAGKHWMPKVESALRKVTLQMLENNIDINDMLLLISTHAQIAAYHSMSVMNIRKLQASKLTTIKIRRIDV